jgi:hypothetical protein
MQQLPKQTHFVIISNDTDLDHVVNLLKSQGRSAERISNKKEENKTNTNDKNIVASSSLASAVKTYCIQLITYSQNRPSSKETLLNNIRTKFKEPPNLAMEILSLLTTEGAITILDKKVIYNDHKIKEISK